MSSNISERRWLLEELELAVELEELESPLEPEDELEVEYFVELLVLEGCLTSVPKSVQFEHTSNFAPSTLIVFGDDVSAPHISHWTIPDTISRRVINHAGAPEQGDGGYSSADQE
ncbi:hypothetical protein C495_14877 [Natronorubrum sulfidifaciens JCM 14089]|uniref:Uncharacterized protein n=1 Tax=Natronorubrum sulfidifaciens JCM 14089 TaxID=1230460 RepID=L9VZW6_9EURY|nr:hypothetical protein C495_14877 [Natronorubrum sulfidifaciens JCM 14089]